LYCQNTMNAFVRSHSTCQRTNRKTALIELLVVPLFLHLSG
jgi:hypothetical protein